MTAWSKEKRSERLHLMVTPTEKARLERLAKRAGASSVADYVRKILADQR